MSGDSSNPIIVRESPASSSVPRVKPSPKPKLIRVPFEYTPSDDGTDENLLILFHGLGDTHIPFARLGKQLKLPQTATLALRAPDQIPYLYEQAFQWYESFDPLGEMIKHPNPTSAYNLLHNVFKHLTEDCQWPPDRVHLFGFAQGGSVATEFALKWWSAELEKQRQAQLKPVDGEGGDASSDYVPRPLGSIVTIAGALLEYPTLKTPCPTPLLAFHRPSSEQTLLLDKSLRDFKKAFSSVSVVSFPKEEGMPRSREEWEPIMRFWSEKLSRRQVEGLYEVMSGTTPIPR
ncbi:hypothetical protein BXZ70DRAFT_954419 [Cristinia sonorae]|uniref:Phospholipase/carboxylesterase/thioesterase domain-containing protein n=1 Tax=Cristinia sonorae TaxID=1940300 RepID=A0A8K0UHY7_9AGAR|nr:hypothetical protein BXZ70DRAFT_954419 [Cristinia sonorae]